MNLLELAYHLGQAIFLYELVHQLSVQSCNYMHAHLHLNSAIGDKLVHQLSVQSCDYMHAQSHLNSAIGDGK